MAETKETKETRLSNSFRVLGSSSLTDKDRQVDDYYATDSKAMELLLEQESFNQNIWECACGGGHLAKVLVEHGHTVRSTDLVYRGYGERQSLDFLGEELEPFEGDIITNPPYKVALQFVEKALATVTEGNKVAMFLRLQFLEGQRRKKFFLENPPKTVYVSSSRLNCAMNGDFEKYSSSAVAYAWFVWGKGFKGETILKWIN